MKTEKIYTYKNKQYKLLYDDIEVKESDSRNWIQGVLYMQIESGLLFVREVEEFYEKFKLVEE